MNRTKAFNPEHDMALANGDRHFIAPRNIREMARDLAPLLDIFEDEQFIVWGWDSALKKQLQLQGIAEEQLPTNTALEALRACSARGAAHHVLSTFRAVHSDGPYTGESLIAHSIDDIAAYAAQHEHIILKDPLSSSGKGLRHVNININKNENEDCHPDGKFSLSSSLKKVENWANALIKRHGYLTAEPYYNKVQDFAMEFCVRDGQCHFIGYSLFNTNHHGRYESNLLMEDEKIEALLTRHIPHFALRKVRDWIVGHSHHIIPTEWDTTKHPLYFGIDMMVVCESQQSTIADSQFKIHPCVEINLRLNMGIIAHEVRLGLLAPNTEGIFHITSFPTEEAAQQFYQEYTERYPATYREGKLIAGYHALTPILPHTRHHAYVLVANAEPHL